MILTDEEIREIDTSEYWFEHTPQEFAREIEKAVLAKLVNGQEPFMKWQDSIKGAHPKSEPEFWPDELKLYYMEVEVNALRAKIASGQEPVKVEQIADLVRTHLTSIYACTRVWEAWQVGTMTEDDFVPASEIGTADEIAAAIVAILSTRPAPAQHSTDASRTARIDTMMRERSHGIKEQP